MTRNSFAHQLLDALGYPHSDRNARALIAWMQAEGGNAKWNPLNTTKVEPGSTIYNSAGVRNYTSADQGISATASTLKENQQGYDKIRAHLKTSDVASATLRAVENSAWGTGGLALKVLPEVRADYWAFANKEIAH